MTFNKVSEGIGLKMMALQSHSSTVPLHYFRSLSYVLNVVIDFSC